MNENEELFGMVKEANDELEKVAKQILGEALEYGLQKTGTHAPGIADKIYQALRHGSNHPMNRASQALQSLRLTHQAPGGHLMAIPGGLEPFMASTSPMNPALKTGIIAGGAGLGLAGTIMAVKGLARKERTLRTAAKYIKAHKNALLLSGLGLGGAGAGAYALTKQSSLADPEYNELEKFAMQRFSEMEKTAAKPGYNFNQAFNSIFGRDYHKTGKETADKVYQALRHGSNHPMNKAQQTLASNSSASLLTRQAPGGHLMATPGGLEPFMASTSPMNPKLKAGLIGGGVLAGGGLLAAKLLKKKNLVDQAANFYKHNRTATLAGAGLLGAGGVAGTVMANR